MTEKAIEVKKEKESKKEEKTSKPAFNSPFDSKFDSSKYNKNHIQGRLTNEQLGWIFLIEKLTNKKINRTLLVRHGVSLALKELKIEIEKVKKERKE